MFVFKSSFYSNDLTPRNPSLYLNLLSNFTEDISVKETFQGGLKKTGLNPVSQPVITSKMVGPRPGEEYGRIPSWDCSCPDLTGTPAPSEPALP